MKKLSIEEKAKAYDKAIERAKKVLLDCTPEEQKVVEYISPELKESEDEKTRKELLGFCKNRAEYYPNDPKYKNISAWIAWLEKQGKKAVISHKFNVGDWIVSKWGGIYQIKEVMLGSYNLLCTNNAEEINSITQVDNNSRLLCIGDIKKLEKQDEQKTDGKIEPKFKVGDWVVTDKKDIVQIKAINNGYYTIYNGIDFFNMSYVDRCWHLWTIQDAKAGDVLSDGTAIFIFKDLLSDGSVMSYCGYDTNRCESDAFCPLSMNLMCSKITPATKEQRDALSKVMHEAGYKWDNRKLELEKFSK